MSIASKSISHRYPHVNYHPNPFETSGSSTISSTFIARKGQWPIFRAVQPACLAVPYSSLADLEGTTEDAGFKRGVIGDITIGVVRNARKVAEGACYGS